MCCDRPGCGPLLAGRRPRPGHPRRARGAAGGGRFRGSGSLGNNRGCIQRPPHLRHSRTQGQDGSRPEPHEPPGGHPGSDRHSRLAEGAWPRRRTGAGRPRRPPQVRGIRPRHRGDPGRGGFHGAAHGNTRANSPGFLRYPPLRLRRRDRRDGLPQPGRRQRLQGLPR